MSALHILFLVISTLTLVSAVMVVTTRKMMHAALWLVLALMGVAALLALLETRFFAVVQLLVYIGAIAIMVIIAVMLTRRMMDEDSPQLNRSWWAAVPAVLALLAGLVWSMSRWDGFATLERAVPEGGEDIAAFGMALVDPNGFVLPFELTSILLLAALVGTIYIATEPKESGS
jgi:NADH-quinone oxidoreductase subunit J